MKVVKQMPGYKIIQKRSGRFGILNTQNQWVRGNDKVKILVEAGLLKVPVAAAPEPEAPKADEPATAEKPTEEAASSSAS